MAITLDTSTLSSDVTTTPLTWAHTVGTSPFGLLIVLLAVNGTTQGSANSVTYGGLNMTKIISQQQSISIGKDEVSIWLLPNPPTGNNTVSAAYTVPTSPDLRGVSISVFGAKQSYTPDATSAIAGTASGAQSVALTTNTDQCWTFAIMNYVDDGASTPTYTATPNLVQSAGMAAGLNGSLAAADSNAAVSAGSNPLVFTITPGTGAANKLFSACAISIAPVSNAARGLYGSNTTNLRPHAFSPGIAR